MSYLFIILIIVFFLFILPIPLKLETHFDVSHGRLYYCIWILKKIAIYSGYIHLKCGKLVETNMKGKTSKVKLIDFESGGDFLPRFSLKLLRYATFNKFNAFFEVGVKDDAVFPTLATAFIKACIGNIFVVIRRKNKKIKLNSYCVTKTDMDSFVFSSVGALRVSIFDIIFGLINDGFSKLANFKKKETKKS